MKRSNPYPGLHRSPAKLADGTRRTYYYLGKGGSRIEGEYGSPEFADNYRNAVAAKVPTPADKLQAIINAYQASPSGDGTGKAFRDLAPRTRADYIKHIRVIEKRFGTMPIAALGDPRARALVLAWRDELAKKSPGRLTTPLQFWLASSPEPMGVVASRRTRVRRQGASIRARGRKMSGPMPILPPSTTRHRSICTLP